MPRPLSDEITQTTQTTQEADGATIRLISHSPYRDECWSSSGIIFLSKLQLHNVCRDDWALYISLHFMSLIPCLPCLIAFWCGAIPTLHV